MATFRSFPKKLGRAKGTGLIECSLSGFLRRPCDIIEVDGVPVAADKADLYGSFGTTHPRDVMQPALGSDPTPVRHGRTAATKSKQDLNISDAEVLAAIRENRPPRPGI